jgi:hypothetical protein
MQIAMDLHIISYHTFKIQTKQGQSVAYPLAYIFDLVTLTFDFENQ